MTLCSAWITETDLADCGCDVADLPAQVVEGLIASASEIIYQLTGSQWPGVCTDTVRPCTSAQLAWYAVQVPSVTSLPYSSWPVPPNCTCSSGSAGGCGCGDVAQVLLGRDNIVTVTNVTVGGVALDPSGYRVDNGRWLVRQDGGGWPCCQDLSKPAGEAGTWSVTFTYGGAPPESVKQAAVSLATEFVKGCRGDQTCRIPNRATTITREGITYALIDPQQFLAEGLTGLYEVDLAIRAVNPGGVQRRAHVYSPDSPMVRTV